MTFTTLLSDSKHPQRWQISNCLLLGGLETRQQKMWWVGCYRRALCRYHRHRGFQKGQDWPACILWLAVQQMKSTLSVFSCFLHTPNSFSSIGMFALLFSHASVKAVFPSRSRPTPSHSKSLLPQPHTFQSFQLCMRIFFSSGSGLNTRPLWMRIWSVRSVIPGERYRIH